MASNGDIISDKFCGIIYGKGCGDWEAVNAWTVAVPGGKPEVITPQLPEVRGSGSHLSLIENH